MTDRTSNCPKCGSPMQPDDAFCADCGAPRGRQAPTPPPLKRSPPGPVGPAPGPPPQPVRATIAQEAAASSTRPWQASVLTWFFRIAFVGLLAGGAVVLVLSDGDDDAMAAGLLCIGFSPIFGLLGMGFSRRWRRTYIAGYFLAFALLFGGLTAAEDGGAVPLVIFALPGLFLVILLAGKRTREYYDITWGWLWFGYASRQKQMESAAPSPGVSTPMASPPPPVAPTHQTPAARRDLCPKCGAVLDVDTHFCGECGTKIA